MFAIERYILHKHDAKTAGLHLDFRVSIPSRDSLASFAIPKAKIPQNPGDKCLCVRGSDHGRVWLNIEDMTIPDGDYGAGKISTISKGICEIEGWSNNHITFRINSDIKESFSGRYALIRFSGSKSGDRNNLWILVKTKTQ